MVPLQTGRPPRFKLYIKQKSLSLLKGFLLGFLSEWSRFLRDDLHTLKQKSLSLLKGFVLGFLSGWSRFLRDDLHTFKQKSLSLLKGFVLGICRDGPASCGTTSTV